MLATKVWKKNPFKELHCCSILYAIGFFQKLLDVVSILFLKFVKICD